MTIKMKGLRSFIQKTALLKSMLIDVSDFSTNFLYLNQ